jgi:Uma2 family endonuclease
MGAPATRVDEQEYLRLSAASETKLEYVGGYVIAMAGASPRHNLVAANLLGALTRELATRSCLAFGSDQRVRVDATGAYVYPDLSVVCDGPRFTSDVPASLTNPGLVIEVLSPSTEEYDRGVKLAHYRRLASVREIALVSANERRVELYRRLESGQWLITDVVDGSLELESIGVRLDLGEVYAKVELLPLDPPSSAAP